MIQYIPQWIKNKTIGPVLPLELILFVTSRCNFRCKHCFIENYAKNAGEDISFDTIEKIAQSLPNLLVLMLTGGEPILRDDLAEIVHAFSIYSKPQAITIATNGFYPDKVENTIKEILTDKSFQSELIVQISFDGIGEEHDRIRGCKGAYDNALKTATRLSHFAEKDSRINVFGNLTLMPGEENRAIASVDELTRLGIFKSVGQIFYRETRPRQVALDVNLDTYRSISKIIQNYDKINSKHNSLLAKWLGAKKQFQSYLIEKTCRENSYQKIPCEAGRNIAVIDADGSVYPCEMIHESWGNVNKESLEDIWNSHSNRQMACKLRSTRCFCTHECFISASINMQFAQLIRMLFWSLKQKLFNRNDSQCIAGKSIPIMK